MLLIFCAIVSIGIMVTIETVAHLKHKLSSLLFLVWMFLFIVGNHEVADYNNYLIEYQMMDWSGIRISYWAFDLLQCLVKFFGFNFDIFRGLTYIIGIFFMYLFVRKTLGWSILFFFFYSIYPMMIDAIQMKNFIAMAIFTYSITFLREYSFNNVRKYLLLNILAAGFHIAILVFLPLIFFKKAIKKKLFVRLFFLYIVVTSLLFSIGNFNESIKNILLIFFSGELESKVDEVLTHNVRFGYLIYYLATLLAFLGMRWIYKQSNKNINLVEAQKSLIENAYISSIYAFSFFPFYMVWFEFSRFFRDLFLVFSASVVIGIQIYAPKYKSFAVSVTQLNIFFYYLVLLLYLFYFGIYGFSDGIIQPLLHSNILF